MILAFQINTKNIDVVKHLVLRHFISRLLLSTPSCDWLPEPLAGILTLGGPCGFTVFGHEGLPFGFSVFFFFIFFFVSFLCDHSPRPRGHRLCLTRIRHRSPQYQLSSWSPRFRTMIAFLVVFRGAFLGMIFARLCASVTGGCSLIK